MKKNTNRFLWRLAAGLGILLCCIGGWTWYTHSTQAIPVHSTSRVVSIDILDPVKEPDTQNFSGDAIPDEVEQSLLQCIGKHVMTLAPISLPKSMHIEGDYIWISLKIENEASSFRVNVSSNPYHTSVQRDGRYYGISDNARLLEEVQTILQSLE